MFSREKLVAALKDNILVSNRNQRFFDDFTLELAHLMREFGWQQGYGNMINLHLPEKTYKLVKARIKDGQNDYVSTYNYEVLSEEAYDVWNEAGARFCNDKDNLVLAEFDSGRYLMGSF